MNSFLINKSVITRTKSNSPLQAKVLVKNMQSKWDLFSKHRVERSLGRFNEYLRFGESWWESDFVVRFGFYANQIRFSEMIMMFDEAGFERKLVCSKNWDNLPIHERKKFRLTCRTVSDDELMVSYFEIILKPT